MSNNNITNSNGCPGVGTQRARICLPVSVTPYAVTCPAVIECCGPTKISDKCSCECKRDDGSCDFIISQMINIDIPVEFGATVKIGESFIECQSPCVASDDDEDAHEYADDYESKFEGEVELDDEFDFAEENRAYENEQYMGT